MSKGQAGRLIGIAARDAPRAPMVELPSATVTSENGVASDTRGRPGPRQVTVLAVESWRSACAALAQEVPWTVRRANLLIEGIDLAESAGRRLVVGALQLEITGETAPCGRMEEQVAGLRKALEPEWRGGVTCRVLEAGDIRVGDPVSWSPPASAPSS